MEERKGKETMSALDKNVEDRTRKDHLDMIKHIRHTQSFAAAHEYWLRNCPTISYESFKKHATYRSIT
jgi:hypothetical protein